MTQQRRYTVPVLVAIIAALAAVGVTALLVNIFTRQQEARNPFYRVVELTDDTVDPQQCGKNFPLQSIARQQNVLSERSAERATPSHEPTCYKPILSLLVSAKINQLLPARAADSLATHVVSFRNKEFHCFPDS